MKRFLVPVIAAMCMMLVVGISRAQMADNPPGPMAGDKEMTPERFAEVKADVLKRIDGLMKRITEEKACVTAAANMEEMKKCRPERPARPGGQGGQGRPFPGGGSQQNPFTQPR